MVSFPHCKINLGLQVLSKRPDGFHEITTCFYPLPWADVLEILPAQRIEFTTTGISIPGDAKSNLCLKAFELLREDFNLPPVQMHLHKVIPMGAGLGGGSSDGAYTLLSLNSIFNLGLSQTKLMDYASQIGSDCSFFIQKDPMLGKGRGNELSSIPLSLKGYYLLIFKPEIHVSTADAYSGMVPQIPANQIQEIISKPVSLWKGVLINDFEKTVFEKHPELSTLKDELYRAGAIYASMSGSGSSIFGIFREAHNSESFPINSCWSGWL